jgi:hypothetical protein
MKAQLMVMESESPTPGDSSSSSSDDDEASTSLATRETGKRIHARVIYPYASFRCVNPNPPIKFRLVLESDCPTAPPR